MSFGNYLVIIYESSQEALAVKNPPASAGDIRDAGSIPGLGRSLEEGMAAHSRVLAWRIPMDRGAWRAIVHRVSKSRTQMKQLTIEKIG